MTPGQMIGYALNQTSAITNIVSTRIYNGNRPDTTTVPCINYYEMAGGLRRNGFERITFSINCRAVSAVMTEMGHMWIGMDSELRGRVQDKDRV